MFQVLFDKKVFKFLEKHKGEKIISHFQNAIQILKKSPYNNTLDIATYKGKVGVYRLRIGKYRFIYQVINSKFIIHCIDADSRGDIYK